MPYTLWSVIFGEQPTAAKWNQLGENDAGFKSGANIDAAAITSEHLNLTIASRAYAASAQNLTSGGNKIQLNTENYDLGSDFDTTNYRFVAPLTGYYQVNANVAVSNLDTGGQVYAEIFVNGAAYSRGRYYPTTSSDDPNALVVDLVPVTAGQYIELYGTTSTTEAIQATSVATYMSIWYAGA